ncbi:helix-hairpin-helix domain-containing protein [Blastococcus capsensis]|uniref:helix-hairpin-helix domain-containing protein n=1 Tax=Blastococcus capsensis TaxID=1564163 RepID=UPI002540B063|nr:helix-hairpin-helix domain-containing protein [Blastococcus capsensis]MDK3258542.1 helix-hairpin-helix domain-containing protein [Blastococcus capsensis]
MTQPSPPSSWQHAAHAGGSAQGSGTTSLADRLANGRWYFYVTVFTAGFLAALPFWHAAQRLGRPSVRRLALIYTAVGAFLVVLMALTPEPNPDGSSGNSTISTIGGMAVVAVVVIGCYQLVGLRREVYGRGNGVRMSSADVVARAVATRQRRQEARRLHETDPALARELGIGRPDLGRGYDDGGLVDLNTASAALIATVSGIDREHADAVVAARSARGGTYLTVAEAFIEAHLPSHVQDQLREHAVV